MRELRVLPLVIVSILVVQAARAQAPAICGRSPEELKGYSVTSFDEPLRGEGAIAAEIRGMLWSAWNQHQRSVITYKTASKEGDLNLVCQIIEPDKSGRWTVFVRISRKLVDRKREQSGLPRVETVEYRAYTLVRVYPHPGTLKGTNKVAPEAAPSDSAYRLQLLDASGEILTEF